MAVGTLYILSESKLHLVRYSSKNDDQIEKKQIKEEFQHQPRYISKFIQMNWMRVVTNTKFAYITI